MKIGHRLYQILKKSLRQKREPTVADNFTDALIRNYDFFLADINKCVDPYGNAYGNGWQFFASIVRNMDTLPREEIISDFVKYLEITAHNTAFDGFRLKFRDSERLKDFSPGCLAFLVPWSPSDVNTVQRRVSEIIRKEKLVSGLNVSDGNPLNGPRYLAENHFIRLDELRNSIRKEGFDLLRDLEDPVQGFVLTRSSDYRILVFSGQHRVAVLSGLCRDIIPIRFVNKYIINESGVDDWPLVRQGLWNREDALMYFNHLFDFDSLAWAKQHDLLG
jgi:hypothetical protein